MPYHRRPQLYFVLTLLLWPLLGHTANSNQSNEHRFNAEQYLDEIASQLKRAALYGEEMHLRRHIFSLPTIKAAAVWDTENTLLFPDNNAITHISDAVILNDLHRLESLLDVAQPTAWERRDIKAELLIYCRSDVVSVCLLVNTTELLAELNIPRENLFSELFTSGGQGFFWWSYVLFILLASLSLIIWHRIRNRNANGATTTINDTFTMGDMAVDPRRKLATRSHYCVDLTDRDIKLLTYLYQHPNEVLSKNELYDAGWGRDFVPNSRALEQHIINLRRKLDPERQYTKLIETVHGQGYRYPTSTP